MKPFQNVQHIWQLHSISVCYCVKFADFKIDIRIYNRIRVYPHEKINQCLTNIFKI